MNNYITVSIKISPIEMDTSMGDLLSWETIADVLSETMGIIGFESFEQDLPYLKAYIPTKIFDRDKLVYSLSNFIFKDKAIIELKEVYEIEGQDWNKEWEKNFFKPYIIGNNKCVIHSSFHSGFPKCEYDIIIDPKMAFGTGHHSTTRLMVNYLLKADIEGKDVLDVGTGSAILSILSSKLKARNIIAVEIDEAAYVNAQENILLNNCRNINVIAGDVYQIREGQRFDYILANINRNVIMDDLPEYVRHIKSGGVIILSGFYTQDVHMIDDRAKQCKLQLLDSTIENNWTALQYILMN